MPGASAFAVIVDERAGRLRRRLGPNAWMVLEELLFAASRDDDAESTVVVRATVRELAERTALSKDTVARAIHKLRLAAIVTAETERHDRSGRFASVRYVIEPARLPILLRDSPAAIAPSMSRTSTPPAGPPAPSPTPPAPSSPATSATSRRAPRPAPDGQLSMLA